MTNVDSFSPRLLPNERILWSGHPATGIVFTTRDVFLIPLSVLWLGFVVFWNIGAAPAGPPFSIFGAVFLCIGLFFAVGRFILDAWVRRCTAYALTERRVLIFRAPPLGQFQAVALDKLPEIRINERADGRGTVRFGQEQNLFGFGRSGMSFWTPSLDPTPQFIQIPDARRVFDLAQDAAARAA